MARRSLRPSIAAAFACLLLVAAVMPVAAWSNGPNDGNGYGTHDWIVDQAVKVLDGRADAWFDAGAARSRSDDPDTVGRTAGDDLGDLHVYREAGRRGGAIHMISELYSDAVAHYANGDYHAASEDIGLLSHYFTDIMNPFHSAQAGAEKDSAHGKYEHLVDASTKKASDRPDWSSASRSVSAISNIRATAIAAAAYSRGKWSSLYAAFKDHQSSLTARASEVTGFLMKRAARDLASIIYAVSQGSGEAPLVATLKPRVKFPYVAQNDDYQAVYVVAKDAAGRAVEGLRVEVDWPLPDGRIQAKYLYTGPNGEGKVRVGVGKSPLMVKRDVVVRATTRGHTETAQTWFVASPKLASGAAGLKTVVSDSTVKPGQVVKVTTLARDTKGRPVAGLKVTWTWKFGTKTVKTTGTTNSKGKAYSYWTITSKTTKSYVSVKAQTQSGGLNRYSSTGFRRTR